MNCIKKQKKSTKSKKEQMMSQKNRKGHARIIWSMTSLNGKKLLHQWLNDSDTKYIVKLPSFFPGNSYAQLTNSPNHLVNAQSSLGSQTSLGSGHQFVSYNGETLLIQTSPNGTHQLVATLNGGRSGSPNSQGLVQLEKPFHSPCGENDSSSPTENNGSQINSKPWNWTINRN